MLARGGELLITADHGNCEQMVDPRDRRAAHRAHHEPGARSGGSRATTRGRRLRDGGLADVAPTVLELLGLPVPAEMTGKSLIVPAR